jgi:DEAD/DEAH box helicase domain-containing protein
LKSASQTIKDCSCQFEGKDGCYRCILSYSNQYIRQSLSRSAAESLFSKIVEAADWEEVSQGISSLTESGMIEESELEKKFPMALKKFVEHKDDVKYSFKSFKDNGITCYQIGLPKEDNTIYFTITPQVTLGEIHGIAKNTRADFVIKCSSIVRNGETIENPDELMAYKDVVVYLDGYRYHASKEHMRFYEDLEIRKAINSTPNMNSWSLSWDDMTRFESNKDEDNFDELYVESKKYISTVKKVLQFATSKGIDTGLIQAQNSMERLIWFLTNSNTPNIDNYLSLYLACFQEDFGKISISQKSVKEILEGQPFNESMKISPSLDSFMFSELAPSNELFAYKSFVKMAGLELKSTIEVKHVEEIEKKVWEEFLRLYSVLGMI